MSFQTGAGVTLAIGTTQAASNETEFEADTYQVVGEIGELGEFGDERNIVEWISLADARVRKARGAANAGDMPVTYAYLGSDDGQDALKAAFEEPSQALDEFNFRVQLNDDPGGAGSSPTTFYFRAVVTSRRVQSITNDGVVTVQATLAINTRPLEVAAEAGS